MRLKSITIQGFANFTRALAVGPLEDVNVFYGPNNVGKSNLLNALELYFRLLGAGESVTRAQRQILDEPDEALRELALAAFNRKETRPIIFNAEWVVNNEDLEQYGLFPEVPCCRVLTCLELSLANRNLEIQTPRWMLGDRDVAAMDRAKEGAVIAFAQQVRRLLADACPFQFEHPVLPCGRAGAGSDLFPQSLRDALFDARQSIAPEARRRWSVFAELIAAFRAELGPGSWETVFDRPTGRADLVYLGEAETLTLERMGAGVQRLAGLLGELVLAREPYVCLEEPEWRLSPALQERFVEMARRVLQAGLGPRQVFITTHNPSMAALGAAFALEPGEDGPTLEGKPWSLSPPGGVNGTGVPSDHDLGQLIGLVEELAELDPEKLLAGQWRAAAAR